MWYRTAEVPRIPSRLAGTYHAAQHCSSAGICKDEVKPCVSSEPFCVLEDQSDDTAQRQPPKTISFQTVDCDA